MNQSDLDKFASGAKVYDLGMDYFVGMPHFPTHPPFTFSLGRVHGELMYEGGVSSANCMFSTGGHTGTHIDALGHIAQEGRIAGIGDMAPWQDYTGLKKGGIEEMAPIFRPGVLLDIAGLKGVDCLEPGYAVGAGDLAAAAERQGVQVPGGHAVLIRTGWIKHFGTPLNYVSHKDGVPGLDTQGAAWLVEQGISLVGGDTVALERTPSAGLPVHALLIAQKGIPIMEVLNLDELAAQGAYSFLLVVSPLKIRGGTGSPVRPLAVVWEQSG